MSLTGSLGFTLLNSRTSAHVDANAQLNRGPVFDPTTAVANATKSIDLGRNYGLVHGDAVVYHNGGGTSIGGLTEGTTYYVHVDPANRSRVTLHATKLDAQNNGEQKQRNANAPAHGRSRISE